MFNDRKVSNVQSREARLNLFFLPIECCSVSRKSLRYRGAKLFSHLIERGLSTVDFSISIKRETLKHMQHVIVKDQISNRFFQCGCSSCAVTLIGS